MAANFTPYSFSRPYKKLGFLVVPLAICLYFLGIYEPPSAKATEGFMSVIIAFEFAQTPEHIQTLLGGLTAAEIHGLDMLNYIDYAFMVLYSGFLFGFLYISRRLENANYLSLFLWLPAIILVADALENMQLLQLTGIFSKDLGRAAYLTPLFYLQLFTWIKWASLAIVFAAISPILLGRGIGSKIAALITASPVVLMIISWIVGPTMINYFALSIVVSFLTLLFYCFFFVHKKSNIKTLKYF